ncbi:MAG: N-acetylmuramic acid 6-phosphate etherase [Planctomycetes bacterium]|nr:N-acetylmuramic acid 6-phosphate etherase [Planctomycetota bacterium]
MEPSTEGRLSTRHALDRMSPRELARVFAEHDRIAAEAVAAAGEAIARAIELTRAALDAGGRLLLAGAGTSGRLAVIEAAECVPTFRCDRVVGVMAGGEHAFVTPREGAEDVAEDGARAARELACGPHDLALGVAASGRTPYVHGFLAEARRGGARVGLVCCAPPPETELDVLVHLPTGPELLSGSTRLKAGTATKCALNAITTGALAGLGKVYDDLMIDVAPTNAKLRRRAARIVGELCPDADAEALLSACDGEVKAAVVSGRLGLSPAEARARLAAHGGHLRRTLEAR